MTRAICDGGGQQGAPAGRGRLGGGGPGIGQTVVSVKGSTLTLEGPGGNREVQLGPETTVSTTAKGAAADLKAGQSDGRRPGAGGRDERADPARG